MLWRCVINDKTCKWSVNTYVHTNWITLTEIREPLFFLKKVLENEWTKHKLKKNIDVRLNIIQRLDKCESVQSICREFNVEKVNLVTGTLL